MKKIVSLMLFALLMSCSQLSFSEETKKKLSSFDITSSDINKEQIVELKEKLDKLNSDEKSLKIELTYAPPADLIGYGDPLCPFNRIVKLETEKIFDIYDLEELIQKETLDFKTQTQEFLGQEKKSSVFREHLIYQN